jgi:hypothetical protein
MQDNSRRAHEADEGEDLGGSNKYQDPADSSQPSVGESPAQCSFRKSSN